MEPYLHRCNRYAECFGRLAYAQFLDIAEQEYFAVDQGQICDRLLEQLPDFLPLQRLGGYLAPVTKERRGDGSLALWRVVEGLHLHVLFAAKTAAGFIQG